jgi:uncharacterized protein YkwD
MIATRRQCLGSLMAGSVGAWLGVPLPRAAGADPSAVEWQVLFLTNQQRVWRKLQPLSPSDELASVARVHSRDMISRGFFDHRNPDGLGPGDRLARSGLRFPLWAENLCTIRGGPADGAALASAIVASWMDSRGHRHNILEPGFRVLGVGVAISGRTVMATELFGG